MDKRPFGWLGFLGWAALWGFTIFLPGRATGGREDRRYKEIRRREYLKEEEVWLVEKQARELQRRLIEEQAGVRDRELQEEWLRQRDKPWSHHQVHGDYSSRAGYDACDETPRRGP